jgi:hypothetical protein
VKIVGAGAAVVAGAERTPDVAIGAVVTSSSGAVVASGRVVVGGGEDMIEPELTDTKVVGARALPGLDRRL